MIDFSRTGLVRRVSIGTHRKTGQTVVRLMMQSPDGGPVVDVLLSVEQYLSGIPATNATEHKVREYLTRKNLREYLGRPLPPARPWETVEEWVFRELANQE